ncbi:flavin reductase [Streptomyces violaceusniger]|uniref:Flavin reductase n=2 Tax=Streptomyces violaceusniger TaxID=68280 RepID=A0A4D4L1P7_STRVO|nr:flavin reductase [Streptomyces violaceusniger]
MAAGAAATPDMRTAMGTFATGVTVVTTATSEGAPAGCTVSAFCSLSLDPPLVPACIGKDRSMHRLITQDPGYAVSILARHQADVALRFARPSVDRFAKTPVDEGLHGIPLIRGAIAHVECTVHDVLDGGDHAIVIGLVRPLHTAEGEPLLYS